MVLPMQNAYSVSAPWEGDYDESALQAWAESLRHRLQSPEVTLGLLFMSPRLFARAESILELLRVHAQIPLLVGCSSLGLIAGEQEIEEGAGLVLGLYYLPRADLKTVRFTAEDLDACSTPEDWHRRNGIAPGDTNGWLVFADPFHMDCEAWLKSWNQAYAPLPVLGGLASGDLQSQSTQVYLNGDVFDEGGIALSIGGGVTLASVLSQGCMPIGDTWTITKADRNIIYEIANRPAYEVLAQTVNDLSPREKQNARGNLFIGLVTDEYREEFHRGDFLVRNLIGADPKSGVLAVGAFPRPGQTIQFQRRDADSSTRDITEHLETARRNLTQQTIYGACLCCCNGRGHRLFGTPHHDAQRVQEFLGPFGLTGLFCNGELGPVGGRSFLHGYTASLALFVEKEPA